jgi:hypothetical protein
MLMYRVNSGYRAIPGKEYMCFRIAYYYACRIQDYNNEMQNGCIAQVIEVLYK